MDKFILNYCADPLDENWRWPGIEFNYPHDDPEYIERPPSFGSTSNS